MFICTAFYYLVASTSKTSISLSEDTFHSQKEGALHLILCSELKKNMGKKVYLIISVYHVQSSILGVMLTVNKV